MTGDAFGPGTFQCIDADVSSFNWTARATEQGPTVAGCRDVLVDIDLNY